MKDCTCAPSTKTERNFTICLTAPDRSYYLSCDSADSMASWLKTLQANTKSGIPALPAAGQPPKLPGRPGQSAPQSLDADASRTFD